MHVLQLLESVQVSCLLLLQVRHQAYVFSTSIPLDQVEELLLIAARSVLLKPLLVLFVHLVLEIYHFFALNIGELDVLSGLEYLE